MTTALAHYRRLAGCTARECAEACGLGLSSYRMLERGTLRGGSDPIGVLLPLARLFSARLGRPISAQWHLARPLTTGPTATAPRSPLTTGGPATANAAGAVAPSALVDPESAA